MNKEDEEINSELSRCKQLVIKELLKRDSDIDDELLEDIASMISKSVKVHKRSLLGTVESKNLYYVYNCRSLRELICTPFDNITDAIKFAVNNLNAYVIHNGVIINYKVISSNQICYLDENGLKLLTLGNFDKMKNFC